MVFRTLVVVFLAFLPVASVEGQGNRKPFTMDQVWALDATYIDKQHGVRFQYPSVWKSEAKFAYHPPALTQSDKPIAAFGYSEGGFPRDHVVGPYAASNLEGFGIVYSAHPVVHKSACETIASAISKTHRHRNDVFGGRTFSERDTGEAGMSQSISGKLYAIYVRPTCYLFETDVAVSSGALPDFQPLTSQQLALININLKKIMASVLITAR